MFKNDRQAWEYKQIKNTNMWKEEETEVGNSSSFLPEGITAAV